MSDFKKGLFFRTTNQELFKSGVRLAYAVIMVFLLAGCGYRFGGSAENRIVSGQAIWVAFINNETTSSSVQTVLRRALLDECHHLRGLSPAGDEATAELRVKGTSSYVVQAVSYTATDLAKEYRLTISAEIELKRRGETTPLWKGTVQAYHDYPVNSDLALQRNAEEAALVAASHTLAQKFLSAVEQSY